MPYPVGSSNSRAPNPNEGDETVFNPTTDPTETWIPPMDMVDGDPPVPPAPAPQPRPPGDGGAPDAGGDGPTPDGRDGPAPDTSPRVPQQVGLWMGFDVSGTLVTDFLSGGGGTVGLAGGLGSDGPYLYGYRTPAESSSGGFSIGVTGGVSVTVGAPTSGPSNVVGGSVGPVGGSVSHTPGANGGPGSYGFTIGASGGPPGVYVTQTESSYLFGGEGPQKPGQAPLPLDGGQCIEGDLDGDGHVSEEEAKELAEKKRLEAENEC